MQPELLCHAGLHPQRFVSKR